MSRNRRQVPFLKRAFRPLATLAYRALTFGGYLPSQDPPSWFSMGHAKTLSGVEMDEFQALTLAAVWACVDVIAGSVGTTPCSIYKPSNKRRVADDEVHDSPLAIHFKGPPNPEMTNATLNEILEQHIMLWGNAYIEIVRDGAGNIKERWPLLPSLTKASRLRSSGELVYVYTPRDGSPREVFRKEDVWHVPGLGFDGTCGYSVISMARENLGLGKAAEQYGAAFYGNDATPGGVLKHPEELDDTARTNLASTWENAHKGPANARKIAILEEGMDYKQIGISPQDAQFLEGRHFHITDVCRWFNVPPHMVFELSKSNAQGTVEEQSRGFYQNNLRRRFVKREEENDRKLLSPAEIAAGFYTRYNMDELLRGDMKTRYACWNIGRQGGWLNADEIRAEEGWGPIPDGKGQEYLTPSNMGGATDGQDANDPGTANSGTGNADTGGTDDGRKP